MLECAVAIICSTTLGVNLHADPLVYIYSFPLVDSHAFQQYCLNDENTRICSASFRVGRLMTVRTTKPNERA